MTEETYSQRCQRLRRLKRPRLNSRRKRRARAELAAAEKAYLLGETPRMSDSEYQRRTSG